MYSGKINDCFEYAINTLLYYAGIPYISSADCASQRISALKVGNKPEECFQPVLNWTEYMKELLDYLSINSGYTLYEAKINSLSTIKTNQIFMLGEVSVPEVDLTATDKFRSNQATFLVSKKLPDYYILSNPMGSLLITTTAQEISKLFQNRDSFIFTIDTDVHWKIKPMKYVLSRTIELERRYNQVSRLNYDNLDVRTSKNKIIFQENLIRYVIRRTRQAEYFGMGDHVINALSEIQIKKSFDSIDKIIIAEDRFRNELNHLWRRMDYVG